jgi:DNA-directed RNA polymerase subunit M/transcription elongation factor TFIIS
MWPMDTHTPAGSEGEFGGWRPADRPCPRCGAAETWFRTWEGDAGHEDEQYLCRACGKKWWVEGIDA